MYSISKYSNKVINTKAQVLISDFGINENLWPETLKNLSYLPNQTETTTYQSVPLKIFLRAYKRKNNNYTQNLKHFKVFRCKAQVYISK